ncbi:MAG: N-acetylmuramoyl-L-alanine amidase [Chitinophagales bacterium]
MKTSLFTTTCIITFCCLLFFSSCSLFKKSQKSSQHPVYRPDDTHITVVPKKPTRKAATVRPHGKPKPQQTRPVPIEEQAEMQPNSRFPRIEETEVVPDVPLNFDHKSDLADYVEKDFQQTKRANGRKFKLEKYSLAMPDNPSQHLNIVSCKPSNGYSGYYEAKKVKKERIVLHFTVGNLKSDVDILTRPRPGYSKYRCSVPFVIARDGNIYQLFGSEYWAYHLGAGTIGGNEAASKKSIAIELSNYGPLILKGNNLETIYSRKGKSKKVDVYCTLEDTHKYIKLKTPFKGYQYFATFTDAQYESLAVLLRFLTAKHKIPRKFLGKSTRYVANSATAGFRGIVSHLNFRATGKWDIGPAFEWDKLIRNVQSPSRRRSAVQALTK